LSCCTLVISQSTWLQLYSLHFSPLTLKLLVIIIHSTLCIYKFNCFRFYIKVTYAVFVSSAWLISFSIMSYRFKYVVTNDRISFFLWLNNIPLYIYTIPSPFICQQTPKVEVCQHNRISKLELILEGILTNAHFILRELEP